MKFKKKWRMILEEKYDENSLLKCLLKTMIVIGATHKKSKYKILWDKYTNFN